MLNFLMTVINWLGLKSLYRHPLIRWL